MRRLAPEGSYTDLLDPYRGVERTPARSRCWVLANMVGGLDGSAAVGGRVGGLSEGPDAELFRRMRALADVVLVGAETVRAERYGPVRLPDDLRAERVAAGRTANPPIAVVTRSCRIDHDVALFAEPDPLAPPLVLTCDLDAPRPALPAVAEVVVAGRGSVDLGVALDALAERGHRVVLCEGGPTLLGQLVAGDLLDELCLTLAPVVGGDGLPIASAPGMPELARFRLAHAGVEADTLFLRYAAVDPAPRADG